MEKEWKWAQWDSMSSLHTGILCTPYISVQRNETKGEFRKQLTKQHLHQPEVHTLIYSF